MRPIAIHLPQFHEVELNNEWWGKGFTDWVKVKNALPLYEGHRQPVIPLDRDYYDMTFRSTMIRQTELMKRGGVYGMAYYHYWYNDEPVLGRPLENLLKWTDIKQRFLLYWGNCDWYYSEPTKYQKKMILHQEYGYEKEWEIHFRYLLRFFRDPRYICKDGKPVFCIYRPGEIPMLGKMLEWFRKAAARAGLEGLYIIETLFNYGEQAYCENSDAVMFREPNCAKKTAPKTIRKGSQKDPFFYEKGMPDQVLTYRYQDMVRISVKNQTEAHQDRKCYFGAFPGWDNTPRHGYKGYVVEDSSPELFQHYISALNGKAEDDDFLFINSWNEWAEGMYLEPDEKYGYGYLDALKKGMEKKEPEKKTTDYRSKFIGELQSFDGIYLYGAGVYGREILAFLRKNLPNFEKRLLGFVDDTPEKTGRCLEGIPIERPETVVNNERKTCFLICCDERSHEVMRRRLWNLGVSEKRVRIPETAFLDFDKDPTFIRKHKKELLALASMLEDDRSVQVLRNVMEYRINHNDKLLEEIADDLSLRYYDEALLNGQGKGNFMDCGGYTGDTLEGYIKYRGDVPGRLICCEPDKENFRKLKEMTDRWGISDIQLLNLGIWKEAGAVHFVNAGRKSGYISDQGDMEIAVETIDGIVGNDRLDFLKIEIDGAEYEALMSSGQVIQREKPVVVVSVYHHIEDILKIPFLLKSYCPDYRLYLRFYGRKTLTDIVCYALPKKEM